MFLGLSIEIWVVIGLGVLLLLVSLERGGAALSKSGTA